MLLRYILPWTLARELFRSKSRVGADDRIIRTAGWIRRVCGFAALLFIYYTYHQSPTKPANDVQSVHDVLWKLGYAGAGITMLGLLFVAVARPGGRATVFRGLAVSMLSMIASAGTLAWLYHWDPPGTDLTSVLPSFHPKDLDTPGGVWHTAIVWVPLLWILVFGLFMLYLLPRHVFRAADVHPFMPALLVILGVWISVFPDLGGLRLVTDADRVHATLVLGAPISLTLLSSWEIYRLVYHYGVTLRDGGPGTARVSGSSQSARRRRIPG